MIKGIKFFVAAFALSIAIVSCTSEAQEDISKTVASSTDAAKTQTLDANKSKQAVVDQNNKKKSEVQASASSNLPATTISFTEMEHHFGTIDEGDKVEHIFKFTNTGSEPLVLEKCKGSCGCTVPTCPKDPILPGGQGEIKVVFNSKGKRNHQEKRVTITANTESPQTVLKIIADVTPDPEAVKKDEERRAAKKAAAEKVDQ